MKKMIKLNNKGFALAETLVTTVFVMIIFTIIYTNYYPIMAEYERRESYDDIDGKYAAYWMKKLIESDDYNGAIPSGSTSNIVLDFDTSSSTNSCGYYRTEEQTVTHAGGTPTTESIKVKTNSLAPKWNEYKDVCFQLIQDLEIEKVYITQYNLTDFKSSNPTNVNLKDYLDYSPDYTTPSPTGANYRIIVEMKRKIDRDVTGNDTESNNKSENEYYAYSTIEVNK